MTEKVQSIRSALELLIEKAKELPDAQQQSTTPPTTENIEQNVQKETHRLFHELEECITKLTLEGNTSQTQYNPKEDLLKLFPIDVENKTTLVSDVVKTVDLLQEHVVNGTLPETLLNQSIFEQIIRPLSLLLEESSTSRSSQLETTKLTQHRASLELALQKGLENADTSQSPRKERQSVKKSYYDDKEKFYIEAIAKLDDLINKDNDSLQVLSSKQSSRVDSYKEELEKLQKQCTSNINSVSTKKLSLSTDPSKKTLEKTKNKLFANTTKLEASLQETLSLLKEHISLCQEVKNINNQLAIREESEKRSELKRKELLEQLEKESQKLEKELESVALLREKLEGHSNETKELCVQQQKSAQERIEKNSKLFAKYYCEYYQQLLELKEGKEKCAKALSQEMKSCTREQQKWEALEHEPSASQNLVRLDTRIKQIRESEGQLKGEIDAVDKKITELEGCQKDVLTRVPDFVHPRDMAKRRQEEELRAQQKHLETLLSKMETESPSEGEDASNSDLDDIQSARQSPYLVRKKLKHINKVLSTPSSPSHSNAGSETPRPSEYDIQRDLKLKNAKPTRGTTYESGSSKKRKRRKVRHNNEN